MRRLYREPSQLCPRPRQGRLSATFLYCTFFFFSVVASYPGLSSILEQFTHAL
uniref:Uncharacterized protein n=1 Tax=Setaria viridis TaxID=4556 RepID=A0A4U6VMF3_SETVI|nr:hypothetical protein SEVIR_3G356350v2 [Setaria viridis]